MRQVGALLSVITWLLVAGSVVIITGGLFGRPILLAAVPSGSMVPVLAPGDMIVVLPTWTMSRLEPNNIVVYKTAEDPDWVVHRIIDGNETEGFVTKGDANPIADPHRVFPGDLAGVVPQWQGGALRLPRFGLLSLESGPLSSPVVAGTALVMGVYLLVLDAKPRVKLPRLPGWARRGHRSASVLSFYFGLAAVAFVTTLVPAWTLSSKQLLRYEVVAQRQAHVFKRGQYIQGEPQVERVSVKNPSPLPITVVFSLANDGVVYDPPAAIVLPNDEYIFNVTVDTTNLGSFESPLQMGVFLPLLPTPILAFLGRLNMAAAALITASVPAVLLLGVSLFDANCRTAFRRMRVTLTSRFFP